MKEGITTVTYDQPVVLRVTFKNGYSVSLYTGMDPDCRVLDPSGEIIETPLDHETCSPDDYVEMLNYTQKL